MSNTAPDKPREQGVLAERRCREHGIRARGRHEWCAGYRLVRGVPAQKFNIRGVKAGRCGTPQDDVEVSPGWPARFIKE